MSRTTYDADDLGNAMAEGYEDGYAEAVNDLRRLLSLLSEYTSNGVRDVIAALEPDDGP